MALIESHNSYSNTYRRSTVCLRYIIVNRVIMNNENNNNNNLTQIFPAEKLQQYIT